MIRPRYKTSLEYDRQFLILDQNDNPVINDVNEALIGSPLDARSMTMRHFGKWTLGTEAGIGILQLADPEIGAAVDYTGKFWQNPYRRIAVSMEPIMAVVYAEDPYVAGDRVRQFHEGIHGKDHKGRNFNALSKDAFYWAHNTFQYGNENSAMNYSTDQFTDADMEQIQRESTTWYSYYGMPMGMVPADWQANVAYRKDYITNKLEMTPAAERAIDMAVSRTAPRPEIVPRIAWAMAKIGVAPVMEIMSTTMIGELPKEFRDRFGIPFSNAEQKTLSDIRTVAKTLMAYAPASMRYSPQAYDAIVREHGGTHQSKIDQLVHSGIAIGRAAIGRFMPS